jgi:hypothetical protein
MQLVYGMGGVVIHDNNGKQAFVGIDDRQSHAETFSP